MEVPKIEKVRSLSGEFATLLRSITLSNLEVFKIGRIQIKIQLNFLPEKKKPKRKVLEGERTQIETWWYRLPQFESRLPAFYCHYKKYKIGDLPSNRKVVNLTETRNTKKTNISYYFVMKSQGFTTFWERGKFRN